MQKFDQDVSTKLGADDGVRYYLHELWTDILMILSCYGCNGVLFPDWWQVRRIKPHSARWSQCRSWLHAEETNGRYSADDIFEYIFLNENIFRLSDISLKFVLKGSADNQSVMAQKMAGAIIWSNDGLFYWGPFY